MSAWTEQEFSFTAQTVQQIPPSTIDYAPVEITLPLTESMQDGKRWYVCNGQLYPSISALISATDTEGKQSLAQWRQRVGHQTAAAISHKTAAHGTRWHKFCEYFVSRQPLGWSLFDNPKDVAYGAHIARVLNTQLRSVVASETRVVSLQYGVAGRMDLAVQLQDGRYAIVDFKTGTRRKSGNRLTNYALQGTFYADALSEHWPYGPINTAIIVQLLPTTILWQETPVAFWRSDLSSRVSQFAQQVNTILG